ncbi:helix-turn-helix domain-containing protein, partial [Candidatus Gracilibacteria bacterium]|nr:helix-turn-helix domain-containing protein [Candidatus Gracilibacteria bacterium]
MKNYSITRKEAGQIAGISLRTLDRYVLSKKIEYKKIKGRVLFCEDDLKKIRLEKNVDIIDEIDTNFDFKKEKTEHKVSEKKEIVAENFGEKISEMMPIMHVKIERDTYKKMFEIANSDL